MGPFLAPWFLLSGLVAAVPLALHLLHRRRPEPVHFSTIRFLREAIASTRRSRNLTNVLTLLMRIFIVLLLAAAFSRPIVRFTTFTTKGKRTAVIILDASASMQLKDGEKTCFDQARAWALQLVGSMEDADRVAVVAPGLPEPLLVFPPNSDHAAVARAVEEQAPGYGRTSLAETLTSTLTRLEKTERLAGIEVHVFSDFQKSGWDEVELESLAARLKDEGVLLFLNRVTPAVAANAGIAKTAFYPPALLGDGVFQARIDVRASADFSSGNNLRLLVEGAEQGRSAFRIEASQTKRLALGGKASGNANYVSGRLELDSDAFPLDDQYLFSLPRMPGIPVLLVDGSAKGEESRRDTFFLRHAIQPRGNASTLFLPKTIDWPTFIGGNLKGYSIVYICNPPALGEMISRKLMDFTREGGTVVLMPGQNPVLETSLPRLPVLAGLRARKDVLNEEKALGIVPSPSPSQLEKRLLAIMPPPPNVIVRRRLALTGLPANAAGVFHYADGNPFAIEVPSGQGSFWITSVSANRDWSDWPLTPFFVLFQQELIKSSARQSLTRLTGTVGSPVIMDWPEPLKELDFEVIATDGATRTVHISRNKIEKPVSIGGFNEPGFHIIRRKGEERRIAVNIPEEESQISYIGNAELTLPLRGAAVYKADTWEQLQRRLADIHQGRPLWPAMLLFAFFLAITEELFANLRSKATAVPDALRQILRRGANA